MNKREQLMECANDAVRAYLHDPLKYAHDTARIDTGVEGDIEIVGEAGIKADLKITVDGSVNWVNFHDTSAGARFNFVAALVKAERWINAIAAQSLNPNE